MTTEWLFYCGKETPSNDTQDEGLKYIHVRKAIVWFEHSFRSIRRWPLNKICLWPMTITYRLRQEGLWSKYMDAQVELSFDQLKILNWAFTPAFTSWNSPGKNLYTFLRSTLRKRISFHIFLIRGSNWKIFLAENAYSVKQNEKISHWFIKMGSHRSESVRDWCLHFSDRQVIHSFIYPFRKSWPGEFRFRLRFADFNCFSHSFNRICACFRLIFFYHTLWHIYCGLDLALNYLLKLVI